MAKNLYLPYDAKIIWIEEQTPNMRLFGIKFTDESVREKFHFLPGQFVFISIPGHGEAAISISSHPQQKDCIELLVRKVGAVTGAMFGLNVGAKIGIRGPFGNGFDIRRFIGRDIVVVAGGCGAAPLRSLLKTLLIYRKQFGKLYFLYGARTPSDLLFKKELVAWQEKCKVLLTVDQPDYKWEGKVGLVTSLFDSVQVSRDAVAVVLGPPVMFKYVLVECQAMGLREENIYLSLERRMKCGIGKCQHCTCGEKYACIDGPVFTYAQIKDNAEALS